MRPQSSARKEHTLSIDTTQIRARSTSTLHAAGFHFAPSLPTRGQDHLALRLADEIANRLAALNLLCLYVAAPPEAYPDEQIHEHFAVNHLRPHLTSDERAILALPRIESHQRHGAAIGWKMENMGVLAWVVGRHEPPGIDGAMLDGPPLRDLLEKFVPLTPADYAAWLHLRTKPPAEQIIEMEDLFYCAHNAVRSAEFPQPREHPTQVGLLEVPPPSTVPKGFDPIRNGGVIHERRHALTWCLSPGVAWDDVDLST